MDLPGDARVYVEAYQGASTQRYPFGTVDRIEAPGSPLLDEVDLSGRVLFRVKVVGSDGHVGRLLASCDSIPALDPDDQPGSEPMILVRTADLGEITWKLDMDQGPTIRPTVLLNERIPDAILRIRQDHIFQALILPAVVREVFTFIFWQCEGDVESDDLQGDQGVSWQRRWLDYGQTLTGTDQPNPEAGDDVREWIEAVAAEFSRRFALRTRLVAASVGNEE